VVELSIEMSIQWLFLSAEVSDTKRLKLLNKSAMQILSVIAEL
jgi:hypothetical protein